MYSPRAWRAELCDAGFRSAAVIVGAAGLLAATAGCLMCRLPPPAEEQAVTTDARRDVAVRAEAAIQAAGESPGREHANMLREDRYAARLSQLKGESPIRPGSIEPVAADVLSWVERAEQGVDWPRPPVARVPRRAGAVTIDGRLAEEAWRGALTYSNVYAFNDAQPADAPATTWKIMWDDTALYFGFDCADTDIVSPPCARDDAVYTNDCVEMFILPDLRFRTYWELIIGVSGSVYDSIQCKNWDRWGCSSKTAETVEGLQFAIDLRGTLNQTNDTDQGYSVEVAFPFSELPGYQRAGPRVGDQLRFMLVRLDRRRGEFFAYAYQPLLAWGHNVWNHAILELVE